MLNMNKKLEQREKEGKIIKCGIVGAGQMGRGMVTQMVLMKGITPAVVSDRHQRYRFVIRSSGIGRNSAFMTWSEEISRKVYEVGYRFTSTSFPSTRSLRR